MTPSFPSSSADRDFRFDTSTLNLADHQLIINFLPLMTPWQMSATSIETRSRRTYNRSEPNLCNLEREYPRPEICIYTVNEAQLIVNDKVELKAKWCTRTWSCSGLVRNRQRQEHMSSTVPQFTKLHFQATNVKQRSYLILVIGKTQWWRSWEISSKPRLHCQSKRPRRSDATKSYRSRGCLHSRRILIIRIFFERPVCHFLVQ